MESMTVGPTVVTTVPLGLGVATVKALDEAVTALLLASRTLTVIDAAATMPVLVNENVVEVTTAPLGSAAHAPAPS